MTEKRCYTNVDALYQQLKCYFEEKSFTVGDRVPAERELADAMQANRTTLRNAMQRMVMEGLIERHVGRGTFFKLSPIRVAVHYRQVNTECSPKELMEFRLMIDPQIGLLAVATAPDAALDELVQQMAEPVQTPMQAEAADITFHDRLAALSGNRLLQQVYDIVTCVRSKCLKRCEAGELNDAMLWQPTAWRQVQQPIMEALCRRDNAALGRALVEKLRAQQAALSPSAI